MHCLSIVDECMHLPSAVLTARSRQEVFYSRLASLPVSVCSIALCLVLRFTGGSEKRGRTGKVKKGRSKKKQGSDEDPEEDEDGEGGDVEGGLINWELLTQPGVVIGDDWYEDVRAKFFFQSVATFYLRTIVGYIGTSP